MSATSRCYRCNHRRDGNARNLVVCVDGTSNEFGQNNTNVVKIFENVDLNTAHPKQYTYYSSGIGTGPIDRNGLRRALDMAFAWSMPKTVKDAYGWLARMYEEGDQIYLFGFSRGAYQVRILAAMIYEVGLIRTPTEMQIEAAYDHYESIRWKKPETRQVAREFKNTFSWKGLRVHFVGVWDTVSSVGFVRRNFVISTSSSAAHACHFRHALALDELRVKFLPEYFHEVNSPTYDRRSKYVISDPDKHVVSSRGGQHASAASNKGSIKEVWFAGSHSDVGGTNTLGKYYHSGNVSLLWMRREAAENGLVLQPIDMVWMPDDLDSGTSDSMSGAWNVVEYLPITHQVSFSGAGENAQRLHWRKSRRIIPGQKIHASILFANTYKPQATLGNGFDISMPHAAPDMELEGHAFETGMGLFDDLAVRQLVTSLLSEQGVAPIYLDRLLFVLRFKEGKKCIRNMPDWQNRLMSLIDNRYCAPLVRLVAIIAYHEVSSDHDLPINVFDEAKKHFVAILDAHQHREGHRVIALLRPIMKHELLRQHILAPDVLKSLMELFNTSISQEGESFAPAVDGLNCLLRSEDTQAFVIGKLRADHPGCRVSTLQRILEVKDTNLLIAALRLMMTLIRIPAARSVCHKVQSRIRILAKKHGQLGPLAVEILLALYDPNDQEHLDIRDPRVRKNIASALSRLNLDRHDSNDSGQEILGHLFGLGASQLSDTQIRLLGELRKVTESANARIRMAATMTLLRLCETNVIRTLLLEKNLLDIFVRQLRIKDKALLAAYALVTCLEYCDMKHSMMNNTDFVGNIVNMVHNDYFDDAIGPVEGFQIFGNMMGHADLRAKIMDLDITAVLNAKLQAGNPKKSRTSLVCLDIFYSFDPDGPWARKLVEKSLGYLRCSKWHTQKAGVTILSALARTDYGVEAISPKIGEIIGMLLPEYSLPILRTGGGEASETSAESTHAVPLSSSWMMGPACALRILAQNKALRDITRKTMQYASLKHLHLTGALVGERDTAPWQIWIPNRSDIVYTLDKMIKTVDEMTEEDVLSIGDIVVPDIEHWDRFALVLGTRILAAVAFIPALLGIPALATSAAVIGLPVYASYRLSEYVRSFRLRRRDSWLLDGLHGTHGIEGSSDEGEGENH